MHIATQLFLKERNGEAMLLPAFEEYMLALGLSLAATGTIISKQLEDNSGVSENKTIKRDFAMSKGLEVSRKMVAFAMVQKDEEIRMQAQVPDLARFADTVIYAKLQGIYDLAFLHKLEAARFGITDTLLGALNSALLDYFVAIPRPRLNIDALKVLTQELTEHQERTAEILKVIDALVDTVKDSQPEFWQIYHNVRKLEHRGQRHLSLKLQVNDCGSGLGLHGVNLELEELADNGKAEDNLITMVQKIGKMGGANIKHLQSGTYLITVVKEGFLTQTIKAFVTKGELTRVMIEMVKNE